MITDWVLLIGLGFLIGVVFSYGRALRFWKSRVGTPSAASNSGYTAVLVAALRGWKLGQPSAICEAEIESLAAHLNVALRQHCA